MSIPPSQLLTTYVVEPLGWMLVHSVWQLATLAAVLALFLHRSRRRSAELHYAVAATALAAMVILPGVTFWLAMPAVETPSLIIASEDAPPARSLDGLPSPTALPLDDSLANEFEEHVEPVDVQRHGPTSPDSDLPLRRFARAAFPWLVGLWTVGVFMLSLWNIGGWIAVQRLVKLGVQPISQHLQTAADRIGKQLGVGRTVQIVQSAVVDVPSVIGWLKPTILLPVSVVTGLSQSQLEAIVAHELAHIRRCDYLANLMQTMAETLLFYHPAVWYASRQMRNQREYIADRLAANLSDSSAAYAAALATLEEQTALWSKTAVTAAGGNLLARIRRLLGLSTNDAGRTGSWLFGAVGSLAALLVLILAPSVHAAIVAGGAPHVSMRRIWADADTDISGSVSPDGRMLAYINWFNGNLGVHRINDAVSRELTAEGTWEDPNQWAEAPVWSPDSKSIAYTWFIDNQPPQVRTVSAEDETPRTIYTAGEGGWVYTSDWAPDGEHILAYTRDGAGAGSTVLIAVADGSLRSLENMPDEKGAPMVSPNGRFAAYDQAASGSAGRDIFIYDSATEEVAPLVVHPADDHSPSWTADGKWLTFLSTRSGVAAAWMLPMADGASTGAAQPLSPSLPRVSALGVTDEGAYIVGVPAPNRNIYVVDYDPENGKVQAAPRLLVRLFEGRNYLPVWSPNGKRLFFFSVRPTPRGGASVAPIVREEATGSERIIEFDPAVGFHLLRSHVAWAPGGKAVLIGRPMRDDNEQRIVRILKCDVTTGAVTTLTTHPYRHSIRSAVSADGDSLYYVANEGDAYQLTCQSISSGDREEFVELPLGGFARNIVASPDGTMLALSDASSAIWFIDLETRACRMAYRTQRDDEGIPHGAVWTPDSRRFIFIRRRSGDRIESDSLWRIAAAGGQPESLELQLPRIDALSVHPNGRQIACGGRQTQHSYEVWSVENSLLMQEGQ